MYHFYIKQELSVYTLVYIHTYVQWCELHSEMVFDSKTFFAVVATLVLSKLARNAKIRTISA